LAGLAAPFLAAAVISAEAVEAEIDMLLAELRLAMFLSGAMDLPALRAPGRLLSWEAAWHSL